MRINRNIRTAAIVICIPVLYAFVLRYIFDVDSLNGIFSIMSITFLALLPAGVGALAVGLSSVEKVKKIPYAIFFPWVPILAFFVLTLLLSIEGWACWLMILPVFLIMSSIGGLIARAYKNRKRDKLYTVSILLLPLLLSPVEHMIGALPTTYTANTYIDINAPREKIWSNVTRVRTIDKSQDKGWLTRFLGFPRPIRAELNYEGVGATRAAIFDKGLVFHEQVLEYIPLQKMVFSIKVYPYEIPSTTMDKHVVVGGNYFDVLDGTYEIEQLSGNKYRLHLFSHFKLHTTFNSYAGFCSTLIMKDIQNNILQVIKRRAEQE